MGLSRKFETLPQVGEYRTSRTRYYTSTSLSPCGNSSAGFGVVRADVGTISKTDFALVALALLLSALLTNLAARTGLGEGYAWIVLFITILYPVFDLVEGVGAIRLSLLFGRGQWSRPWWGLILFALADSINSFYWLGGYQWLSAGMQIVFNVITNVTYPAGYLIAGLALLTNYYIIRYGEANGLMKPTQKVQ